MKPYRIEVESGEYYQNTGNFSYYVTLPDLKRPENFNVSKAYHLLLSGKNCIVLFAIYKHGHPTDRDYIKYNIESQQPKLFEGNIYNLRYISSSQEEIKNHLNTRKNIAVVVVHDEDEMFSSNPVYKSKLKDYVIKRFSKPNIFYPNGYWKWRFRRFLKKLLKQGAFELTQPLTHGKGGILKPGNAVS